MAPPGLQQDREALGEGAPVQAPVPWAPLAAGASPAQPGVSRSSLGAHRALGPPPSPRTHPASLRPVAVAAGPEGLPGHVGGAWMVRTCHPGLERVEGCCRGCRHPLRVQSWFCL